MLALAIWVGLPLQPAAIDQYPGSYATCVERAEDATTLSSSQTLSLCNGATSDAPLDCFLAAQTELPLSDQQSMDLCRFARSMGPVDCFADGDRRTTLSDQQLLAMCSPAPSILY